MAKNKSSINKDGESFAGDYFFQIMFHQNPTPMWIFDLETRAFLDVNKSAIAKYGYTRKKFLLMSLQDIYLAKEMPRLIKGVTKLSRTQKYTGKWKHKLKNGKVIDVSVSFHRLGFNKQKTILVIAQDITFEKRVKATIGGKVKLLRTILNNAPITIFALDSKGVFTLSEGKGLERVGMKPGENVGVSALELYATISVTLPSNEIITGLEVVRRVMAGETIIGINELRGTYFENQFVPYRDTLGKVIGMIGVATIITERIQAENALRESEKRFRALVEKSFEGISLLDFEGKFLYQANFAKLIYGYEPEELIGKSAFELVHPDFLDTARKTFSDLLNSPGNSMSLELKIKHKDNSWRWIEIVVTNLFNEPFVKAVVANYRDITDRKKAVDQLQKVSTAVQQSADSIFITNREGIIEFVNKAFEDVTGYSKEEAIGKTPRILKSGVHSPADYMKLWNDIFSGFTYRFKFSNKNKNGKIYIDDRTITPVKNEIGEITHFVATGRDITEKERLENELNRNSKVLQSFFDYSISPLALLDKDFNFIEVNEAYAKAGRRKISDFSGHNHFEVYPSDAKVEFEKVVVTKETLHFVERPFGFSDHPKWGDTYWDWTLTPILDKTGDVEFLVLALTNVTQRKKVNDEIKNSRKQLRALYAHLQKSREEERARIAREIHDSIGQGLTGLKMDLSLLEDELIEQEDLSKRDKLYGKIQSMYSLLDWMIQSVRDVSTQLRPLILDSLGLVTAIEWQAEEFQKKTGLTCVCFLPKEKVELNHDESTVLFRIFQECLTNIIRHAKATQVSIKLERKENHILLEVQDNGVGIPENVVTEINSLGLLGMKERALVFGGSVTIRGNPGKGTIVTVKIPHGEKLQ
ncbi:MAG: PAS domain-containing sensor histidine kinase [Ignavibacteriaceae bacterium]